MSERDTTAGQNTGTLSRAHALLTEGCPVVPGGHNGRDTSDRDRDTPRLNGGDVPVPLAAFSADEVEDPAAELHRRERVELTRIAAQRIVDQHAAGARWMAPESLEWARQFVRMNRPLGQPLSSGEPSHAA